MNSLIFSHEQTQLLITALSEYLQDPPLFSFNLTEDMWRPLMKQCIKKLTTFSIFTSFSKQEFTVMLLAADHYEKVLILNETEYDEDLYTKTISTLSELAGPADL